MEFSQAQPQGHNHRVDGPRLYQNGRQPQPASEREASYYAALELVDHIDRELARGTTHYRNRAGKLLHTLDEVVNAILSDDLLLPQVEADERVWVTPQELAA